MSLKKAKDYLGNDLQVDSAIKDAKGQVIHQTYQVKPVVETFTITTWTAESNTPYEYKATGTITTTLKTNSIVELINDNSVDFATYGFCIGSIVSQTITFYSVSEPSSSVNLKVIVWQ